MPRRRMGPANSETRSAMLDAAERVLLSEGYAGMTSRRIAEEAGMNQPLFYYYFITIDDLLVATFRRRIERALERLTAAMETKHPLRTLLQLSSEMSGARLSAEFLALANHNAEVRAEAVRFVEQSRALEAQALSRVTANTEGKIGPSALALIITTLSQALAREKDMGISAGHQELRDVVKWVVDILDPEEETATPPSAEASNDGL